eukprot:TRINITY_DN6653_c0_g2_i2.p1 TRINITY_DN6653_c0_g2~~TRINITY_DN6653_c0_g2_i2.p1  ORF type:complete len:373 (+),score=83.75 TRINITY_DN6653_c0_g2_i2:128-1246(+)
MIAAQLVPDILNCPGPASGGHFAPIWDQLHDVLAEAKAAKATASMPFDLHVRLAKILNEVAPEDDHVNLGFLSKFLGVLQMPADLILSEPQEAMARLEGFCLFGTLAAYWAAFLYLGAALEVIVVWLSGLQGYRKAFLWVEETRWQEFYNEVEIWEALQKQESATCERRKMMKAPNGTSGGMRSWLHKQQPTARSLRRLWSAYQITPGLSEGSGRGIRDGGEALRLSGRELAVVLVGDHAALGLDVRTTLEKLLSDITWTFDAYGHYHYCKLLRSCDEPFASTLRAVAEALEGGSECIGFGLCSFQDFVQHIRQAWPAERQRVDLVVCTRWWLLCSALREAQLPGLADAYAAHVPQPGARQPAVSHAVCLAW